MRTKLYIALESGKLELDDLAPRIRELRAYQHELQQQRDNLLSRIESNNPEKLDANEVMSYANELEQVLGEASFLQQKTFLRRFVKRAEINPKGVVWTTQYHCPWKRIELPRGKFYVLTKMVAHTGFEPVISSLRGTRPRPLDECAPVRCLAFTP